MAVPAPDYPALLQGALLGMVRDLLRGVADEGLPGEHHFYLNFRSDDPGVVLSESLRRQYPEEMTVVLQHQFWELEVDEETFSVTLQFDGRRERLTVPFAALRSFVDPVASFGLKLQQFAAAGSGEGEEEFRAEMADVVSLERFRSRHGD